LKIFCTRYADNRIVNEDYKLKGQLNGFALEVDEFIASVDKGQFLPYVTLHSLVQDLLENKTLDLTTPPQAEWDYLEVLVMAVLLRQ
jgi:hypothetical protein